jgi:hypothetical protein
MYRGTSAQRVDADLPTAGALLEAEHGLHRRAVRADRVQAGAAAHS